MDTSSYLQKFYFDLVGQTLSFLFCEDPFSHPKVNDDCRTKEYCSLTSRECSQLFPPEHLLQLHCECLLCLDIPVLKIEG